MGLGLSWAILKNWALGGGQKYGPTTWAASWGAELANAVAPAISGAAGTDLSTLPGFTKVGTGAITMDGSGGLNFTGTDSGGALYTYDTGSKSRMIEVLQAAAAITPQGNYPCLIAAIDVNNWLGMRMDAGGLTIGGKIAGAFITDVTVVGPGSGTVGTTAPTTGWSCTLRAEVINNTTVNYYVNGALRFTGVMPAAFANTTTVGMINRVTAISSEISSVWMAAGRINHGHARGIGQGNQSSRAQTINGKVYFGTTTWTSGGNEASIIGQSRVHQMDPTTGATTYYAVGSGAGWGDGTHCTPSISLRPDGRLIATYSQHSDTVGLRYRISVNPYDISAWSQEYVAPNTGGTGGSTDINPYVMSLTNQLVVVFRGPDTGSDIITSSNILTVAPATADGGALPVTPTWSALQTNIALPPSSAKGIYTATWSDGVDRIDYCATNAVDAVGNDVDVRHGYYLVSTNQMYTTAGVPITNTFANFTAVATTAAPDSLGALFGLDIIRRSNGLLEVVFQQFVAAQDHRYWYASCSDNATWVKHEIDAGTTPGTPDSRSGSIDISTATNFVFCGQLCIDFSTPGLVYVAVGNHTQSDIYAYQTTNGGSSFIRARVSPPALPNPTGAARQVLSENIYPFCPRNAPPTAAVMWSRGRWDYYDNSVGFAYALDIMSAGSTGTTLVP